MNDTTLVAKIISTISHHHEVTLFERITSTTSDLLTLVASSLAIFLFFTERNTIVSAFRLLLNYSKQLTLNDLKSKIERLNDHNADDDKQRNEVLNILHEIEGQILGNKTLKIEFSDFLIKVISYTSGKKILKEAPKRSLVTELRELLRNTTVESNSNNKKK